MRDIKFRAFARDRKAMYDNVGYIPHINGFSIIPKDSVTGGTLEPMNSHSHNIELMQYTGLKDRNDIEIYEGDIVKLSGIKKTTRIEFIDGAFFVVGYGELHIWICEDWCSFEVIGNIYENKELLNVQ